jgi:hypothetical protein
VRAQLRVNNKMRLELMKMGCADDEHNNSEMPCNGRGECAGPKGNETCICEIKFTGDFCSNFNRTYHAGIKSLT